MPRCPTCHRRLAAGAQCPRDGDQAPARVSTSSRTAAPTLPGYSIDALIGEGGSSCVWEATEVAEQRLVAIKTAHAATAVARHRFAKEAEALAAIGSRHVPALYDHGVLDDGRPYLVMERLREHTLAQSLQKRDEPPVVAWVRDVGDAVLASLEAVHAKQLIHRDLKPENIFLSESPLCARLTDFGIVRTNVLEAEAAHTSEHTVLGTVEYMAPEQLSGQQDIDMRVDIYAFGVLLFELLTLRVPFTGDLASIEKGHRTLRPPRPSEFASVPAALEELCLACLAKDAARRPPDVASLRHRLTTACKDAGNASIQPRSAGPATRKLLSGTRQPVVLLAMEVPSLEPAVTEAVKRRKGFVARQQGLRLICAFSGVLVEKPLQMAMAVAHELVEQHGARVVLHFANLRLRPGLRGRPPKIYGPAVQEPSGWLPGEPWNGMLTTAAVADILAEERTRPSSGHPGFYELIWQMPMAPKDETVLFGREDVLARAMEELRDCLEHASPGLCTIIGEHGVGKSRLARVIADLIRHRYPDLELIELQASRRSVGRASETHRRLLHTLSERGRALSDTVLDTESSVSSLGDQIRRAAKSAPLVLILDDAHYADDVTLDALEYATLDGPGISLWIAVCAHPRLERRRPQWGGRAHKHTSIHLEPLDRKSAMDMAAALLVPAEFPPRAVLEKLAQWTGGNPQSLEQLVRTLKKRGFVRQGGQSKSWYVATAELERLPASPVGQWLAGRHLDALPPEQAACVRVCAVLGQEFSRDELAWVQSAAEREHTATTTIDTDIGLSALEEQGIISRVRDDIWAFNKVSFQDAIYKLVAKRDREHIHRSALGYWQTQEEEGDVARVWASIARHAGACGAREIAADAHLEFGDRARREHRYVEADLHYTAALGFVDDGDDARRARILGGLGRVRYRMQRVQESVDDLRRAQRHALALGERGLVAELVLEESMALDWAARYGESAERVGEARALLDDGEPSVRLQARYLLAEGRSHYRAGRTKLASESLAWSAARAEEAGDDETRIIALLLLSTLMVFTGGFDEAQKGFDTVLELCERTKDRLHLCVAYNNRASLWSAKKSLTDLRADLRRAIQLAREVGQPVMERGAAHNLAEFLYWSGQYEDALVLARRAYELRRFLPEEIAADALLLARILTAYGYHDEARVYVDEARHLAQSGEPAISDELVIKMLDLALTDTEDGQSRDWDELIRVTHERFPGQEFLEVLYFRARAAAAAERWALLENILAAARDKLEEYPVWEAPFTGLEELARVSSQNETSPKSAT